ncbi:APC family permease [Melioribacter sp. OK-6-Me]|uniref:APC family permease n=1 Tax=unclassified Melioribacter TaxID=2627329 RepID=UPI003ED86CC6
MKQPRTELVRGLSLTAAVMIVAGSMIGSGIFRKPSTMAQQLGSPELLILVWIAAGLVTLIGAYINAELAGMFDETGGQYIYFKKMYGDFTSYIYGWSILSVIQTGSQAAIAYVFAEYVGYFVHYFELPLALQQFNFTIPLAGKIYPFYDFGTKSVAIIAIIFLTAINYIGVITGGSLQTVITYIKIGIIVIFSLLLILVGNGSMSNVYTGFRLPETDARNLFDSIGLSFAGAFWAYDAWNNITFVSGEVKNANRNVPLGLLFGVLIVISVYVFINIAYLYVLPVSEMANSPLVAATAAEKVFGNFGGNLISLIVIISTFGALNGSILATARVPFAMSKSKLFFDSLGKVHPRFGTPYISLVVQGIWSCILVLSGTFDTITDYVMFASWLFYLLGAYGIFVMRKKIPDAVRPYKVWGYPYTPVIFIFFASYYLITTLISDTENAMLGLILVLSGLPFYFFSRYRRL